MHTIQLKTHPQFPRCHGRDGNHFPLGQDHGRVVDRDGARRSSVSALLHDENSAAEKIHQHGVTKRNCWLGQVEGSRCVARRQVESTRRHVSAHPQHHDSGALPSRIDSSHLPSRNKRVGWSRHIAINDGSQVLHCKVCVLWTNHRLCFAVHFDQALVVDINLAILLVTHVHNAKDRRPCQSVRPVCDETTDSPLGLACLIPVQRGQCPIAPFDAGRPTFALEQLHIGGHCFHTLAQRCDPPTLPGVVGIGGVRVECGCHNRVKRGSCQWLGDSEGLGCKLAVLNARHIEKQLRVGVTGKHCRRRCRKKLSILCRIDADASVVSTWCRHAARPQVGLVPNLKLSDDGGVSCSERLHPRFPRLARCGVLKVGQRGTGRGVEGRVRSWWPKRCIVEDKGDPRSDAEVVHWVDNVIQPLPVVLPCDGLTSLPPSFQPPTLRTQWSKKLVPIWKISVVAVLSLCPHRPRRASDIRCSSWLHKSYRCVGSRSPSHPQSCNNTPH
eukprot:m.189786 g.189786  ORF g.189786 m.189786 type:complete len:499 (+) comp24863_c0_seq4:1250-2746(+)